MCSAPHLAVVPELPWSWLVLLGAAVPIVVGVILGVVLVDRLTTREDRGKAVRYVCKRLRGGRRG